MRRDAGPAVVAALALCALAAPVSAWGAPRAARSSAPGPSFTSKGVAAQNFYFPPSQSLQFASREVGWLVYPGAGNEILGTSDGGRHWWTSYRPTISPRYVTGAVEGIDFVNVSDGWALLYGRGIMRTTDGGHSWSAAREPPQGSVMSYTFSGPTSGWALTASDALVRTSNGGRTWTATKAPGRGASLCATGAGGLWLGVSGTGDVYHLTPGHRWQRSLRGSRVPYVKGSMTPRERPAPWISCAGRVAWLLYNYGEGAGSMPYVVERTLNGGGSWRDVVSSEVSPSSPRTAPGVFATVSDFGLSGGRGAWLLGYCGPCNTGSATIAVSADASRFSDTVLSRAIDIHATPVAGAFHGSRYGVVVLEELQLSANGLSVIGTRPRIVIARTSDRGARWRVVDANLVG
jgi:Photosynthesis system II assembly factor YCF48